MSIVASPVALLPRDDWYHGSGGAMKECPAATTTRTQATTTKTVQLLVRFQDKTHVVTAPAAANVDYNEEGYDSFLREWLLEYWSQRTGWHVQHLVIRSWQPPSFIEVTIRSSLRGGKGGFGTLLKGQSRQAGAKLTTDFGACRDLQGRRLRHVNDEIKLRKWREMERRKASGETVADDVLWNTPSGIYNWHLMTPTWADISKKATYRIKRQFQQLDKEAQKKQQLRQEQEEVHQKTLTQYLEQATNATAAIQENLQDAIKQGLSNNKKRKRPTTVIPAEYQPNSLVTLSGEVVVSNNNNNKSTSVQMQSKSDFCTAVLVLDKTPQQTILNDKPSIVYYEVSLESGGMAQIGWASLVGGDNDATFQPNDELGDGVGDDAASFGVDGSRGLKFHAGKEEAYDIQWKPGDRLGCLWNITDKTLSFQVNGQDYGVAFSLKSASNTKNINLVPAFSCNQGEILELHTTRDTCEYFPKQDGAIPVGDLIASQDEHQEDDSPKSKEADDETVEAKKPAAVRKEPQSEIPPVKDAATTIAKNTNKPVQKAPFDTANIKPIDLTMFESAQELESLGMDRLKGALMAIKVKCGGTLAERAARLFSLKGLQRKDYPKKVRAKGFLEY